MAQQNTNLSTFDPNMQSGLASTAQALGAQNSRAIASRNRVNGRASDQDRMLESLVESFNQDTGVNIPTNAIEAKDREQEHNQAWSTSNGRIQKVTSVPGQAYALTQGATRSALTDQLLNRTVLGAFQSQRISAEGDLTQLANPSKIMDLKAQIYAGALGASHKVSQQQLMAQLTGEAAIHQVMKNNLDYTFNTSLKDADLGTELSAIATKTSGYGDEFSRSSTVHELFGIEDADQAQREFIDLLKRANNSGKNVAERFGRNISGVAGYLSEITPIIGSNALGLFSKKMDQVQIEDEVLGFNGWMGPKQRGIIQGMNNARQMSMQAGKMAKILASKIGVSDTDRKENIAKIASQLSEKITRVYLDRSEDRKTVQESIYKAYEQNKEMGQDYAAFMGRLTGTTFYYDRKDEVSDPRSYTDDYSDLGAQIDTFADMPMDPENPTTAEDFKIAAQIVGQLGQFMGTNASRNTSDRAALDLTEDQQRAAAEEATGSSLNSQTSQLMRGKGLSQLEVAKLMEMHSDSKTQESQFYSGLGNAYQEALGSFHINTGQLEGMANKVHEILTPFGQLLSNPEKIIDSTTATELLIRAAGAANETMVPALSGMGLLVGDTKGYIAENDKLNPVVEQLEKMRQKFRAQVKNAHRRVKNAGPDSSERPRLFHDGMTNAEKIMMIGVINEVQNESVLKGQLKKATISEAAGITKEEKASNRARNVDTEQLRNIFGV